MAINFQDYTLPSINDVVDQLSEDERKKRQQEAADNATPVKQTIETNPVTGEQNMTISGSVKDLSPSNPMTPTVSGPAVPEQVQPQVNQQPTQEPVVQELPQQTQQPQVTQPQATAPVAPVTPVSPVEMPQPGPSVQVAGPTQLPPAPWSGQGVQANQPATQEAAKNLVPPDLTNIFNDPVQLAGYYSNTEYPEGQRKIAGQLYADHIQRNQQEQDAHDVINKAVSGDPRALSQMTRDLTKDRSEGSYLKAILYSRLGLTDLAKEEQQKLGAGRTIYQTRGPDNEMYTAEYGANGDVVRAWDKEGNRVSDKTLVGLGQPMKGATTGGTMGFDKDGNVISHTMLPNGRGVIWKNETTGQTLSGAPEGYHQGKNQQETMSIQAYQRSRANDESANRRNIAKGLAPIYSPEQIEERAQNEKGRIMGISTTTYGGGGEGAVNKTPTVPPAAGQSAADWAIANNIPVSTHGGTRTTQEQANQLAQWYQGGMKGPRPAEPGRSAHESGNAIDVPTEGRTPENRAKLEAAGFRNTVAGEPWHFERTATPQVGEGAPSMREVQSSNAKAISEYQAPPLTGSGMGGQNAITMAEVYRLNPNYDPTKFKAMQKTRNDFATGPQGKTVTAMNTAVAHLDTLNDAGEALKNNQVPVLNQITREFAKSYGLPEYTNFEGIKHVVGTEVAKAVAGSGQSALSDRQAIEKEFDSASSPLQLKGIIKKYQELMGGQLKSQKQNWVSSGLKPEEFDNKLLPRTKKVINSTEEPTRSKW